MLPREPIKQIQLLLDQAYFKTAQVAQYLDMSDRTFRRKLEGETTFDRLERERIAMITRLIDLGEETFGSNEKFLIWMQSTPEVFEGACPLDLLTSQQGIEWIEETLYAIQHGLPA